MKWALATPPLCSPASCLLIYMPSTQNCQCFTENPTLVVVFFFSFALWLPFLPCLPCCLPLIFKTQLQVDHIWKAFPLGC